MQQGAQDVGSIQVMAHCRGLPKAYSTVRTGPVVVAGLPSRSHAPRSRNDPFEQGKLCVW